MGITSPETLPQSIGRSKKGENKGEKKVQKKREGHDKIFRPMVRSDMPPS